MELITKISILRSQKNLFTKRTRLYETTRHELKIQISIDKVSYTKSLLQLRNFPMFKVLFKEFFLYNTAIYLNIKFFFTYRTSLLEESDSNVSLSMGSASFSLMDHYFVSNTKTAIKEIKFSVALRQEVIVLDILRRYTWRPMNALTLPTPTFNSTIET